MHLTRFVLIEQGLESSGSKARLFQKGLKRHALFLATVLALLVSRDLPAAEPGAVSVQAIRIADDDGRRRADISPEQVALWVAKANESFAAASLRFDFNPADFADLRSTLLNNLTGTAAPNWTQAKSAGEAVAAQYPGKLTVLFRYGASDRATGAGFSSTDYAFVAMPGFAVPVSCGHQNITLLAHEMGHYFGLPHTFAREFDTVAAAEAFLLEQNSPGAFEGDGFSDTVPDPFIRALECGQSTSVLLNGSAVPLARGNLMSYYDSAVKTLSPQQVARVRWILAERQKGGMMLPKNRAIQSPLEAESLEVAVRENCSPGRQVMTGFGAGDWSGEAQLFINAGLHSAVTLVVPVATIGDYQLNLFGTRAPDFGTFQFQIDGEAIGQPIDAYAPIVMPTGRMTLGTVTLAAGRHLLRLEAVGKNAAATRYYFGLDAIELVRLGPAPAVITNLSVRSMAGTGDATLIAGFTLAGSGTKPLLIRGVGPTLAAFGVDGALSDPTLQLSAANAMLVVQNNDWRGDAAIRAAAASVGAFALPPQSGDAALLQTLGAGSFTAQIGGGSGIALIEIYDARAFIGARLANVSARTTVGTGGDILIAGFTIAGERSKAILVRAVGPGLESFGVSGVLPDPRLRLFSGLTLVAENNDWGGTAALAHVFTRVGAFALAPNGKDAALLVTLPPGGYTAQLSSDGPARGISLIEVYDLDP